MASSQVALQELHKLVDLFKSETLVDTLHKTYLIPEEVPARKWSLNNRLLMMMSGTIDARGYKQWRSSYRQVQKGSKAIYILAPMMQTIREEGKDPYQILTGFRGVPVFRVEDTEGADVCYVKNAPKQMPPLSKVAEKWGVKIQYFPSNEGEYGYFNARDNVISLATDDESTFFHELAHKAHSTIEPLKGGQDPEQEAIAQLTAAVLARLYGKNVDGYTFEYIGAYADGKTTEQVSKMCMKVLSKVEKILEKICTTANELEPIPA